MITIIYLVFDVDNNVYAVCLTEEKANKQAKECDGHCEIWTVFN